MLDESDPLTTRTARQRIGGRWALSWQTYIITAVLGLFALIAGEAQATTGSLDVMSWLAVGLAGVAGIGVTLLILNATIFRNRRMNPLPIWVVVLADGFIGLVFSLVVELGALVLDLPTSIGLVERCILNVLYAMWWGPTLSYFMDLREQWIQERAALITESVHIELAALQQGELFDRLQQELDAEVELELTPARERMDAIRHLLDSDAHSSDPQEKVDWQETADLIRGTAENSVRPLSRELWQSSARSYPTIKWWSVPKNIMNYQPFRPLAFAVIDILGTFSPLIHTFGIYRGLALLFGGLAWTILLMLVANALMHRFPRHHALIFVVTLIALQSTVFLREYFREMWVPGSSPLTWILTQIIAGLLVVFATSGFGAWWGSRVELQASLREEIRADQVQALAMSQRLASVARETSQQLHGSVQTRLISCAMVIERANTTGDTDSLNAALNEAIAILEQPRNEASTARSLNDEVMRKVDLWEGLCEVHLLIDPAATSVDNESCVVIGRVVEEGLSNAIRHGKATALSIDIDRIDSSSVRVCVIDNGRGPQGGNLGIGSAYLGQTSGNRWSLTPTDTGSRLEVLLTA